MHATNVVLEPYAAVHGGNNLGWHTVAAAPLPFLSLGLADEHWLHAAPPDLLAYEAHCQTEGDSLTHGDVRSDTICIAANHAIFVNSNLA